MTTSTSHGAQRKGNVDILAPAFVWGAWYEIWAQFGVSGPYPDTNVSRIKVTFDIPFTPFGDSSFDVEIEGGDYPIYTVGPGAETVTVTGNVATALRLRARSHSIPLNIRVRIY